MKMAFTSLILVAVIQAIQFSCHSRGQGLWIGKCCNWLWLFSGGVLDFIGKTKTQIPICPLEVQCALLEFVPLLTVFQLPHLYDKP